MAESLYVDYPRSLGWVESGAGWVGCDLGLDDEGDFEDGKKREVSQKFNGRIGRDLAHLSFMFL